MASTGNVAVSRTKSLTPVHLSGREKMVSVDCVSQWRQGFGVGGGYTL